MPDRIRNADGHSRNAAGCIGNVSGCIRRWRIGNIHGIVVINPFDMPQTSVGANGRSPLQNIASQPENQDLIVKGMKLSLR